MCSAEVIVIKTNSSQIDLRLGGHPVIAAGEHGGDGLQIASGFDGGTVLGKRYTDKSGSVELLCTKSGASSLSIGDTLLEPKDAKPLPSSD